jgi:hypothetical protein
MAGTRRIGLDSHGCLPGRPAPCQDETIVRRGPLALLVLALALGSAPAAARADGRPSDAGGTVCTYGVPEATPYDTPQGHIRVHYVADPAAADSPALTATRVAGVPDWVVAAGADAEAAWAREVALGFTAPPGDDGDGAERGGDGRYDIYVCNLGAPGLGELAATVADPPGSGFSYVVVDNDYAAAEVAPLATTGLDQLRLSIAHELFHAIQIGEGRGRLPDWLAEATAVWMEGTVVPSDVDRQIYRVALGGGGTEQPYWRSGALHEYGAWSLVAQLERGHPGFVARLVALSAARGDDDPKGLALLARAIGGPSALASGFARFARTALDDPLVGPALRARRTSTLRSGWRLALHASVQPLSLRLWRVPLAPGVRAVTLRNSGAAGLGVVVRRGGRELAVGRRDVRLVGGQGPLLVLVAGAAGEVRDVRVVITA